MMHGWKATAAFFMSSLAMDVSAAMMLVALAYLAMDFGATSLTLGILAACRAVVYISTIPIFGHFSDRGNRKGFIIAGVMVAIAMSSAMALTGNLTQLFVVAILWTFSGALFWPSLFGWTGDAHKPEELAKGTGTVNVAWTIGAMLGFFAGGVLYEVRPSLPFLCAVVPAASGGVAC